jgi:hypothetical protein
MLDQGIELKTTNEFITETLLAVYAPFVWPRGRGADSPDNTIKISAFGPPQSGCVTHDGNAVQCESIAQLLHTIENFMFVALQIRRPDLFFVHAAAVSTGSQAILICGESGAGKSTLCWSLCGAGYHYLSDELAPVSLEETSVQPFPKAITLKRKTKDSPALPPESIDAGATIHVPANTLPGGYETASMPMATIIFLLPQGPDDDSGLIELSAAEAAARLYANGLNQLAHADDGLAAAVNIVRAAQCYGLRRAEIPRMLAAVGGIARSDVLGSAPKG